MPGTDNSPLLGEEQSQDLGKGTGAQPPWPGVLWYQPNCLEVSMLPFCQIKVVALNTK